MSTEGSPSARQILGDNIRRRRKTQGMSQEELADRAGMHRTYLGAIERAEQNVSIDNIERVAVALGCAPYDLLQRSPQADDL